MPYIGNVQSTFTFYKNKKVKKMSETLLQFYSRKHKKNTQVKKCSSLQKKKKHEDNIKKINEMQFIYPVCDKLSWYTVRKKNVRKILCNSLLVPHSPKHVLCTTTEKFVIKMQFDTLVHVVHTRVASIFAKKIKKNAVHTSCPSSHNGLSFLNDTKNNVVHFAVYVSETIEKMRFTFKNVAAHLHPMGSAKILGKQQKK